MYFRSCNNHMHFTTWRNYKRVAHACHLHSRPEWPSHAGLRKVRSKEGKAQEGVLQIPGSGERLRASPFIKDPYKIPLMETATKKF